MTEPPPPPPPNKRFTDLKAMAIRRCRFWLGLVFATYVAAVVCSWAFAAGVWQKPTPVALVAVSVLVTVVALVAIRRASRAGEEVRRYVEREECRATQLSGVESMPGHHSGIDCR